MAAAWRSRYPPAWTPSIITAAATAQGRVTRSVIPLVEPPCFHHPQGVPCKPCASPWLTKPHGQLTRYPPRQPSAVMILIIMTGTCVCYFVLCVALFLLNQYWEIVTVPGSFLKGRGPGMAGSSPFTLTTSLVTPVLSSGPTSTQLTTRGFCPGGSVVWAGPKFVRPHW